MSQITIACLQLEALGLARADEALDRALRMIDEAAGSSPDMIVLPECTYPAYYLHSLEQYQRAELRSHDEVVQIFAQRARIHRCHLVVGLAAPADSGRLFNAAYLFGPDGAVLETYAKRFLWHFDQYWFDAGQRASSAPLPFGQTGMFVCADGRMPEIARTLALQQTRLLIDPTAWVSSGGDRSTLSNPQFEYMMPVRAMENGAWIVVANKVGVEAESIVYCGRSCVVSPDGRHVAQASTDTEEILLAELDLSTALGPPVRRRPECYSILGDPIDTLPITSHLQDPIVPAETVVRVGAVQLSPYPSPSAFIARAGHLCETLVRQETDVIVLPGIPDGYMNAPAYQAEHTLTPLCELSRRLGCAVACTLISENRYKTVYLIDAGDVLGTYRKTHLSNGEADELHAGDSLTVHDTPYGRIGILLDDEGLIPEVPRSLMLQGADLILWPAQTSTYPLRTIARSRADENKIFVAVVTPLEESAPPQTAIVNPGGAFMASTLPDIEQAAAGQIAWGTARYKEMAPNTNVVHNRQPAAYQQLLGHNTVAARSSSTISHALHEVE